MAQKTLYTFGFQVLVDEADIQEFLVASSGSINDMQKPIVKKKLKQKIRNGKLHLAVEVTFIDGTKMTFEHKTPFDFNFELMEMTEEELFLKMQEQGMIPKGMMLGKGSEASKEEEPSIGFEIHIDDDKENEED